MYRRAATCAAKVDREDAVRDMQAAINALSGQKVGVVGYCWGGSLAWNAATRLASIAAAVGYYGGMVPGTADEHPKHPTMLHFGENDQSIPKDGVKKVIAAHPDVPIHIYPAGHGFNCDRRGSYDDESAKLAREHTMALFTEHLG